jgi:putative ATP-binding cassette transporter
MTFLIFLVARSRTLLILAITFGLLSGAANAGMLALINQQIAARGISPAHAILWCFVGLWVFAPVSRVISELLLVRLGEGAAFSLRTELVAQILAVPFRDLESVGLVRILPALTEDVPSITHTIADVPILCINMGVVLSCFAYMAWLNWRIFGVVMVCVVFGAGSYQWGVSRATKYFHNARKFEGRMNQSFQALVAGIKELKIDTAKRQAFVEDLNRSAELCQEANTRGLGIYSGASSWGQLLVFTTIACVLLILFKAHDTADAAIVGFPVALLYLMTPLQVIMNALPGYMKASVAVTHIKKLGISLRANAPAPPPARHLEALPLSIAFEDVCFAYTDGEEKEAFFLGPITGVIHPGEVLFIVGGNGSGKTTLAKLLLGLYSPASGRLKANDRVLSADILPSYQEQFSVVFADFYLPNAITGTERGDKDSIASEYLKQLDLADKVTVSNGVFSTTNLSQGQRKRLALLMCCVEDRPAMLFDEWAADQDPGFKAFFYRTILPDLRDKGKTVIVITHDERFFDIADQLWFMEDGNLKRVEKQTQRRGMNPWGGRAKDPVNAGTGD